MTHCTTQPWPFHRKLFVATCAIGVLALSLATAQDPFDGDVEGKAGDPLEKKTDKEKAKGKARQDELRLLESIKKDPLAIQHVRESNPTTSEELVRAAQITLDFGRADEAKKYLAKFLAVKADPPVLVAVGQEFSADLFIRFSREPNIQPEGKQVADLVLNATTKATRDPALLATLIGQLSDPDPARRELAREDLAAAGTAAVGALITVLGDPARAKEHRPVQGALVALATDSEAMLLGALESPNEAQRIAVIETLGYIGSHEAVPYLVRPAVDESGSSALRVAAREAIVRITGHAPNSREAEVYLQRKLDRMLDQANVLAPDLLDIVTVYRWDEAQKGPIARKLPQTDVALMLATRLAGELHAMVPDNAKYTRLYLMTNLELAKVLAGLEKSLPRGAGGAFDIARQAGPEVVHSVLADSIRLNRVAAAIAACEVLGEIGTAELLNRGDGRETELAKVLRHSDRRLRFSAAQAISKINPRESFPGASHVTESLAHVAATSGSRRVLIGHPRGEAGQSLVGFMNDLGYEGEAAFTGKTLMHLAIASPDYDFILISDAVDAPRTKELIQWLRQDYRTARLPIGVMCRGEFLDQLKLDLQDDTLTTVFPRIHDLETAGLEASRLTALAGRNLTTDDERVDMAAAALESLAAIASQSESQPVYDLLRHEGAAIRALVAPGLSAPAAKLLGILGTPKCQTSLVDFVSQNARPLSDRQAGAAAFAEAVRRRGILLTKTQILEQYERYNSSATLDKETQDVLAGVLDTLESRQEVSK